MAGLHFDITGDNSNFMEKLRQTENGVRQTSKRIEQSGVGIEDMFNRMAKAAAGFGAAFSAQQFASQVMKVRGEFQQLEVAFNTMLGSAEKASDLMAQLTRTAAITPFGLQDVAGGAKQLLAYGVASEQVNDTLIRLGDIAAGLSIPLNDLVYLYGTTMTQGRMFTQDLRQFQGRGIPLADELAKQFGVTKDKVGELVTAGKVGFEEMNKAIISMTSEGGKFGGLMEAQSKTITGQISNIEDAIDVMFNEIGKSSEGVINTALGGVSALVENYEKVGEAIGVAVTAYGAYKAAVMVGIAWQKAEAAVTAEAALQKTLAAMAGHTLTASQAKGAAVAQLYAASQAKVVASLKALASATILNPYVLIAGAIAATTYGIYKLANAETEEERATRLLNKALDEQNKKYESHRKEVDELISTLGNLELSEGTRIANFQQLKREYPEILKNINTENEFLREKYNILQQINQQQAKNKQQDDIKLLEEAERKLENIKKAQRDSTESTITNSYLSSYGGGSGINYDKELNAQLDVVNKLKARVAQPELDKYLEDISKLGDTDITEALEDTTHILQALENAGDNAIGYVTELNMELSKSQIQTLKSALQDEQKSRGGVQKSASEWLKQYKEEYDDATKAVNDFMTKKNKMSETLFERGLKELTDKQDAAKKKYEAAGGSTKTDNKQIEQEEKKNKELLNIQRKNEQDRINLMEKGTEKRLAQIELDYQKEIDAYEEAKKKFGETEEVKAMKTNAEKKKKEAELQVYHDEAAAMRDFLKEYGTYQQQKLAIAEEYAEKIKKAQTEGEKLRLGKERDKAVQQVEIGAIKEQINFSSLFGGFATLFQEQLQPTIDKLREITTSDAFKSSSVDEQKIVYELINNLQKSATVWDGDIFVKVSNDLERYQKAQLAYNEVMNSNTATAEQVSTVQRELAEATTNLQSSASEAATMFETLESAIGNLASGSLKGIGTGLMQLDALFGKGEITKDIGNALAKGATSLFGKDSAVTKTLSEGLGNAGFIGQIIAAILSILDFLKEGIGTLISSIIDTILGAINGILKNILSGEIFAQIGKSLYEGIGSILDTITFGGMSSWFSSSNAKEVAETTERLTQRNEVLTQSIDALKDEMEKARGMESVTAYDKAVEKQKELIENTGDVLAAQMGYHGAHHSNSYYIEKAFTDADWANVSNVVGKKVDEVSDLWNLSPEELQKVSTLTDVWDKIYNSGKYDKSEYLDAYLALAGTLEELETGLKESLTQISFDSMYDSFIEQLMDMDASSKDFADNISEYFMKAMLSNKIGEMYSEDLENWYDKFAEYMKSEGTLSDDEMDKLRKEYEGIVNNAMAERDAIASATGYKDTYSQEATSKGYESMSQDQGEELNGRFTALQISNEEIKNQMLQTVTILSQMTGISSQQNVVLGEILQQQALANIYLADIVKYTKVASLFGEKLDSIVENTKNL